MIWAAFLQVRCHLLSWLRHSIHNFLWLTSLGSEGELVFAKHGRSLVNRRVPNSEKAYDTFVNYAFKKMTEQEKLRYADVCYSY